MTAPALVPPSAALGARAPRPRPLALLALAGSPVMLAQWLGWLAGGPAQSSSSAVIQLSFFLYLAGFAAAATALRRGRVTGRGRGAAIVTAIQAVGLLVAAGQPAQDLLGRRPFGDAVYLATDLAWPFSHVFMLVVGVAVLRARVWTGWRRWTPLACGLVLPASLAVAAVGGHAAMGAVFCPGTALAFGALAVALLRPEV